MKNCLKIKISFSKNNSLEQGLKRFENKENRTVNTKYNFPTVEITNYNVIINWESFFDQPVKNNLRKKNNIIKMSTVQKRYYASGCLSDYNYFNNYYKILAIDLSKQEAPDPDLKPIQQSNFSGNLSRKVNAKKNFFFLIEEVKETVLGIWQGTVKVLRILSLLQINPQLI